MKAQVRQSEGPTNGLRQARLVKRGSEATPEPIVVKTLAPSPATPSFEARVRATVNGWLASRPAAGRGAFNALFD